MHDLFAENLLTDILVRLPPKFYLYVIKEDKISTEVLRILEESQENIIINKKLTDTSTELKKYQNN
jgi:hypothetical protein